MIKKTLLSLCFISSLVLSGCFFQEKKQEDTRFMMDTVISIQTTGTNEKKLKEATDAAFIRFQAVADATDAYTEHGPNDLYTINAKAGTGPHPVADDLYDILLALREQPPRSSLDITLGPVISLWNGHRKAKTVPTTQEVQKRLLQCGPDTYTLKSAEKTISMREGAKLDLGAVAKGYAIDRAAEEIIRNGGVKTALINAGGNIKVIGTKKDGKPWSIGIQAPDNPQHLLGTIPLTDGQAVATSGDYQRYYEVNGIRYHHILDPETGFPARRARSVSVVTDSAFRADLFSTLLFVLSREEALSLAEAEKNLEIIYVDNTGEIHVSSGLQNKFQPGQ